MVKITFYKSKPVENITVRCIESKGSGYYDDNMKRKYLKYGTKYTVKAIGGSNYFLYSIRGKKALGWHNKENFEIIK